MGYKGLRDVPQPLVPQEGWRNWNIISDAVSLFDFSVGAASFLPDCRSTSDLCQSGRKKQVTNS